MMVHLTKNEITHLVYILGHGDGEQPELNSSCLNKLKPLIEVCTCKEPEGLEGDPEGHHPEGGKH